MFPGKDKKGGHKILSKSQRCCEGNDVLLCVKIELDPSTITSKKDLHLEPLNTTLVFKEMIGKKEYKYGNDEFDLTFAKPNSNGTSGFSNYKKDGRVLLIENCKKNKYVVKIVIKEDAKNVLKDQEPNKISVEDSKSSYCRHSGKQMYFGHQYVATDYYRSTCISRCNKDYNCAAWTWDVYNGDCWLYKRTFSTYAWYFASGPDINRKSCNIGGKRCWIYFGITDVNFVAYAAANTASTCEDLCRSSNVCSYWNWYLDTCYMYKTVNSYSYVHQSAEWC